jgi:hypothetical protein
VSGEWTSLVSWHRKAPGWYASVVTSAEALAEIAKLPVFESNELYPVTDFRGPKRPQLHVLVRPDGTRFVVDTQGYGYARYIAQLPPVTVTVTVDAGDQTALRQALASVRQRRTRLVVTVTHAVDDQTDWEEYLRELLVDAQARALRDGMDPEALAQFHIQAE